MASPEKSNSSPSALDILRTTVTAWRDCLRRNRRGSQQMETYFHLSVDADGLVSGIFGAKSPALDCLNRFFIQPQPQSANHADFSRHSARVDFERQHYRAL